jgi:hypothetical protein
MKSTGSYLSCAGFRRGGRLETSNAARGHRDRALTEGHHPVTAPICDRRGLSLEGRLSAAFPGPLWERPNVRAWFCHANDFFPPAASTRRSEAATYVTRGKDLPGPTVALEKPARAVLAMIHVVRCSELAKAMAGCDFNLTQAATR